MQHIELEEAKAQLLELVEAALRGDEIVLTQGSRPILKLVPVAPPRLRPGFGGARELIRLAEDFDEPLADFEDYTR